MYAPICSTVMGSSWVDGLGAGGDPGDVDALALIAEIAVSFWDVCQTVSVQDRSYPRRIPLGHLVDAEHELHVKMLLAGKLG